MNDGKLAIKYSSIACFAEIGTAYTDKFFQTTKIIVLVPSGAVSAIWCSNGGASGSWGPRHPNLCNIFWSSQLNDQETVIEG